MIATVQNGDPGGETAPTALALLRLNTRQLTNPVNDDWCKVFKQILSLINRQSS